MKKRLVIFLFSMLFMGFTIDSNGQECMTKLDSNFDLNIDTKPGLFNFSSEIQTSMKRVMSFFDISVEYYLVEDGDGICHKFVSNDGLVNAKVFVGSQFLSKYKDKPWYVEMALAHEAGHTLQYIYNNEYEFDDRDNELQADILAGIYFGFNNLIKKIPSNNQIRNKKGFDLLNNYGYEFADYNYSHSNHHGTAKQRLDAFDFGHDFIGSLQFDKSEDNIEGFCANPNRVFNVSVAGMLMANFNHGQTFPRGYSVSVENDIEVVLTPTKS